MRWLQDWAVVVALVALYLIGAITQPDVFLSPDSIRLLLVQNASVGIIAIGMTLVIVAGGIDLSVGSMMALSASVGVVLLNQFSNTAMGQPLGVGLVLAVCVLCGLVLGAINGSLTQWGRIAPFIATLGGLVAYRSLSLVLGQGGEIRVSGNELFQKVGQEGILLPFIPSRTGGFVVTWSILAFVVIAVGYAFLLGQTAYGRRAVACGSNEIAARYSAIDVRRIRLLAYSLLGACCGLAAFLQAARMNSVPTAQIGQLVELDAIAAAVIGGASLNGGRGRIWGTFAGVLLLGVIGTFLTANSVNPYWQGFVKGAVILVAVLIQRERNPS